jgi:pimeloyl-ACP methyl ester carboxylesterase
MEPDRRTLLSSLCGLAAGGLLAGCQSGNDSDSTPTDAPTTTRTAPATPTTAPPTGTATPGESERAAMRERVRTFLQLFIDEEFGQAHGRLGPQAAEQITAERLDAIWSQLQSVKGRFVGLGAIEYQGRQQGYDVFVTQIQFRNGRQRAVVALADDAVAGLQFPPGEEWQPPEYADESTFTERELSLSAPERCSLGATLTLPDGSEQVPGVVLVHGNGAQDRDQTIGPNKTFKELAWGLATRGVAVLRYDKRTMACDVDKADATIDDIVTDDAVTALERLRAVERVGSVTVVGHSIGGTLAPRIAARDGDVAGVVVLAGLARSIPDAIVDQQEHLANLDGTVTEREEQALTRVRRVAEKIRQLDIDDEVLLGYGGDEYYRTLGEYDHLEVAAELDVPRLFVQGGRDWQVTAEDDLPLWREALADQSNVQFEVYPNLNHRFQPGDGPETVSEYYRDRSVARAIVTDVAAFVRENTTQ